MAELAIRIGIVSTPGPQLKAAPRKLRPALGGAMKEIMKDVWARASRKVSGDVLRVRSGHLRRSIGPPKVAQTATGAEGTLGAKAVYARIHEEGGMIKAHTVRPRHAKALRFFVGGQAIFARSARIPAIRMPKRPFMGPALTEAAPAARARLGRILEETLKGA
jgi:phage gpG-like protein